MRQEYNTNGFTVHTPFMMYAVSWWVGASLFCPCNERVQFQTLVCTETMSLIYIGCFLTLVCTLTTNCSQHKTPMETTAHFPFVLKEKTQMENT
jgi:hypothetical protein